MEGPLSRKLGCVVGDVERIYFADSAMENKKVWSICSSIIVSVGEFGGL
jgi:hypothetical protein